MIHLVKQIKFPSAQETVVSDVSYTKSHFNTLLADTIVYNLSMATTSIIV